MRKSTTTTIKHHDGDLVKRRPNGVEEVLSVTPISPMSEADIEAEILRK
jgi:hypothetical protein